MKVKDFSQNKTEKADKSCIGPDKFMITLLHVCDALPLKYTNKGCVHLKEKGLHEVSYCFIITTEANAANSRVLGDCVTFRRRLANETQHFCEKDTLERK